MKNVDQSQQRTTYRRRRRRVELGKTEKKRLTQLGVSVVLLLMILAGKGLLPGGMGKLAEELRSTLRSNADFTAAFAQAGEALQNGAPVWDTLGDFCVTVFGASPVEDAEEASAESEEGELLYPVVRQQLNHGENVTTAALAEVANQELGVSVQSLLHREEPASEPDENEPAEEMSQTQQEPAVLPVGAVVKEISYTGDALPEHASMAWLSLGDLETQNPIDGVLTSSFSYRDHPIDGNYGFHYGADLAAAWGTDITAFAAGTVEFTGESDSYGLYLQLDHGNGIKSFYAHCSSICVRQGQSVALGEKIAEVGDTGNATGPHLHLQIKLNDTWLNPLYYITART